MSFSVPAKLEASLDEVVSRYPQKRSASLMFLHALQEHFGWISKEAVEWTAEKLGLQPINVYELVTFYPMFREEPIGKHHIRICRTLSCALEGSYELRERFCSRLGIDQNAHGPVTSEDGEFTIEFVECLAACGTAPVLMLDDDLHERVSLNRADEIIEKCRSGKPCPPIPVAIAHPGDDSVIQVKSLGAKSPATTLQEQPKAAVKPQSSAVPASSSGSGKSTKKKKKK
jgi:NADH-quinone oxidoreductase subunit E